VRAITHYRRDFNQRLNEFKATPVHDWSSHGADAFRGLAVRHKVPADEPPMPALRPPECLDVTEVTREAVERWQRMLGIALEKMDGLRLSGELDESFYEELRASLLAAGATGAEIDGLAAWLVTKIVEWTPGGSGERDEQFELIVDHLACTKMRVCLGGADSFVSVEFPNRARVQ
jgi:hypothetical protein